MKNKEIKAIVEDKRAEESLEEVLEEKLEETEFSDIEESAAKEPWALND